MSYSGRAFAAGAFCIASLIFLSFTAPAGAQTLRKVYSIDDVLKEGCWVWEAKHLNNPNNPWELIGASANGYVFSARETYFDFGPDEISSVTPDGRLIYFPESTDMFDRKISTRLRRVRCPQPPTTAQPPTDPFAPLIEIFSPPSPPPLQLPTLPAIEPSLPPTQPRPTEQVAGAYTGIGFGTLATVCPTWTTTGIFSFGSSDPVGAGNQACHSNGFLTSVYAGYQWTLASRWLAGIETDIGYATNSATTGVPGVSSAPGDSISVKEDWNGGLRARLGYAVAPKTLVYGTTGVTFQHLQATVTCTGTSPNPCGRFGPVAPMTATKRHDACRMDDWRRRRICLDWKSALARGVPLFLLRYLHRELRQSGERGRDIQYSASDASGNNWTELRIWRRWCCIPAIAVARYQVAKYEGLYLAKPPTGVCAHRPG
jgi:opacity protein-like surface antigen